MRNTALSRFLRSQIRHKNAKAESLLDKNKSISGEVDTLLEEKLSLEEKIVKKGRSLGAELDHHIKMIRTSEGDDEMQLMQLEECHRQKMRLKEDELELTRLVGGFGSLVEKMESLISDTRINYAKFEKLMLAAKAQIAEEEAIKATGRRLADAAPLLKNGNTIREMADYAQSMLDQDHSAGSGDDSDGNGGDDQPTRSVKRRLEY